MGQLCAGLDVGILDLHRNGLCIEGRLAILHNLDGYGGKALCNAGNSTVLIHFYNALVTGLELHSSILGEVGIQGVGKHHGLGGVHSKIILALEEPLVAGLADVLILRIDDIVSLGGGVAVDSKHIGHGLIIVHEVLVVFVHNCNIEGDTLVGLCITNTNGGLTGGNSHQLVVDTADHGGVGGYHQQLAPLILGVDDGR